MAVIDLTRDPGPSVQESTANINRVLDLLTQREKLRQDKQLTSDFVTESIRLMNQGVDPDEAGRLAALTITEKGPTFDKGIAGLFQKFSSPRGPSTTLTGPIASGILGEPTGIRRDVIKAQLEATQALTKQRRGVGGVVKPTAGQKQRDSDIAIVNREKATPTQKNEAKSRLLASGQLVEPNASKEEIDAEFSDVMDGLKELSKVQKGDVLDRRFGKDAFDAGLKESEDRALKEGVDPRSIKEKFNTWWDEQFAKEEGQTFQKFQDRKEFQGSGFGNRPDGSAKGDGFLGVLQLPGGGVATEFSVGVQLESKGGAETDIPTLVPTLTKQEIDLMINDIIPNQKEVPPKILQKAVDHANKRVREGKSVFADETDVDVKGLSDEALNNLIEASK